MLEHKTIDHEGREFDAIRIRKEGETLAVVILEDFGISPFRFEYMGIAFAFVPRDQVEYSQQVAQSLYNEHMATGKE